MYNLNKLKILVIGPEGSGKTTVTNFLCEKSNVLDIPYRPTAGVRIIETEKEVKNKRTNIEFWDVSGKPVINQGNNKYDRCWPAIMKGAQGIIIVYNADNPKSESEVEFWIEKFPKAMHLPAAQCVGFAHHLSGVDNGGKKPNKGPKGAASLVITDTSVEEGPSTILPAFDKFVTAVVSSIAERQEKEENNLMN
jgi:Rab-like protein 5